MTNPLDDLQPEDLDQIRARGIDLAEIERQLTRFVRPPSPTQLERPCRPNDGIRRLRPQQIGELETTWQKAATGRSLKFVPASGAASRMFSFLSVADDQQLRSSSDISRFFDQLEDFPFFEDLETTLEKKGTSARRLLELGEHQTLLASILGPGGMGLDLLPKGLLPFHHDKQGWHTAFDEHIQDALGYCTTESNAKMSVCRLHFTVLPGHLELFRVRAEQMAKQLRNKADLDLRISFSVQDPSTDTLAVDPDNRPFRQRDGCLLFRPSGHGALLGNLASVGADLVFVKNIDNISTARRHAENARWKRALAGLLVQLVNRAHKLLAGLETASAIELSAARDFLAIELCFEFPADFDDRTQADQANFLIDRLDRPLRICGVVPAAGEPGGGPFWVRDSTGCLTGQIIEQAQVNLTDPEQEAIWRGSTHFNPVDLVCSLQDRHGRRYELEHFVDSETAFISQKSVEGRPVKVLERPGLWNGSMGAWNTVFVEVPAATFTPVKTVLDLLRPEHQEGERS